jgi:hypothetical protein
MKKLLLISILLIFFGSIKLFAQAISYHYSASTGDWADPQTWVSNDPPSAQNRLDISINANHTVTHYGDLVLQNSITINVHPAGNLIIEGNVNIGNNNQHPFTFEINGTATIHGNLEGYGNIVGDGELYLVGDGYIGDNMNYDDFDGTIFLNGSPLPIELMSFAAFTATSGIELSWTTATEVNNMGFEIQRLDEALDTWQPIGFVQGHYNHNGLLQYSFLDQLPMEGVNYYRLKQMDFDGAFEYFGPVAALHGQDNLELSIRIVKSQNSYFIVVPGHEAGQIEIFDMHGRLIMSRFASGHIDVPLTKGAYIVRFFNGVETLSAKFIL